MNQKSTKEKIIDKSLEMFNRDGVENVTTRHIAKELCISQGNLHYHYANKDRILEALFSNMLFSFKQAERLIEDKALDPEQVLLSMTENFEIMSSYRLFFQQKDVIWRRLPVISDTMKLLFQTKHSEIITLIELYKKEGKFREEISPIQIRFLAEQFIFNIQSWLNVKDYNPNDSSFEYYAKLLFRLWLPYLNTNEMKIWENLLD